MKKYILKFLNKLVLPFYGTGIGNYWPFNKIKILYESFSKKNAIITKTSYGFNMILTPGRVIDNSIISYGYWEKNISDLIINTLSSGDIFLDLGANIGYDSLLASKKVGEKGKVISFEPNTDNYYIFRKNIEINNFKNIEVHKLGVGMEDNEVDLFYDEENPGATSTIKRENHNTSIEKIKIVKLDDFIKNQKIDFIKMDIEGFEYEAILGMEKILKINNLKLIFEFSPIIYKYKEESYKSFSINILNTLIDFGFDLFHIHENGDLEKISNNEKYFELIDTGLGQSDIYCIKSVTGINI